MFDVQTDAFDAVNAAEPLLSRVRSVRAHTHALSSLFSHEDQLLQAMPDASPIKWHLAHTTWFFETFVLKLVSGYRPLDERYQTLFNSYYNGVGPQPVRAERGLWSRPSLSDVAGYRQHVDRALAELEAEQLTSEVRARLELGLHHEQQHQELMLTDTLAGLAKNPLAPAALPLGERRPLSGPLPMEFCAFGERRFELGFSGSAFHFDNEVPSHTVLLSPFQLALRPVNNAEVIEFVEAGGYQRPELWLSEGWSWVQQHRRRCPAYWKREGQGYTAFSLHGPLPVEPARTACHLSYFEADALARYFDARLPTETEWECAAVAAQAESEDSVQHFDPSSALPAAAFGSGFQQLLGTVWEWTSSAYCAYPGFRPAAGAIGEYNGKFMFGQQVLRGGSLATPEGHIRPTYRNFFPGSAEWQFSGVRLARDLRSEPVIAVKEWVSPAAAERKL